MRLMNDPLAQIEEAVAHLCAPAWVGESGGDVPPASALERPRLIAVNDARGRSWPGLTDAIQADFAARDRARVPPRTRGRWPRETAGFPQSRGADRGDDRHIDRRCGAAGQGRRGDRSPHRRSPARLLRRGIRMSPTHSRADGSGCRRHPPSSPCSTASRSAPIAANPSGPSSCSRRRRRDSASISSRRSSPEPKRTSTPTGSSRRSATRAATGRCTIFERDGMIHLNAKLDPESGAPVKIAIEAIVTADFRAALDAQKTRTTRMPTTGPSRSDRPTRSR